jgi:hypothetical protein
VQTNKRALAKIAGQKTDSWDDNLPNTRVQTSTGFSTYHLLHSTHPSFQHRLKLHLSDPNLAAAYVHERSLLLQQDLVIAGENLSIAQHRDQLRNARNRSGSFTSKLHQMPVGSFVWLKKHDTTPLDLKAQPVVLGLK